MFAYQTVIVGVSEGMTRRVLRQISMLAVEAGAELILVAAREPVGNVGSRTPGLRGWAEQTLTRAAEICAEYGARDVEKCHKIGDPVSALVSAVREHGADLLLVGNQGLAGPAGRLLGAVPGGVAREAPCDVMIARIATGLRSESEPGAQPADSARTLVVGVHGTPRSMRAAERAASIAAHRGSRLVVVGAEEPVDRLDLVRGSDAPSGKAHLAEASFHMDSVLRESVAMARARGVAEVEQVVVRGPVMSGLLAVAHRYEADVLVVGNNPHAGPISRGGICTQNPSAISTHVLLVH